MSDEQFEARLAEELSRRAHAYQEPADPVGTVRRAIDRRGARHRRRLAAGWSVGASALLLGVALPLALGPAHTVAGALDGVFASPTVQFTISESGEADLAGYSLEVTLSNPDGGPVSADSAFNNVAVSLLHDGSDLADFVEVDDALYLHLDIQAVDSVESDPSAPDTPTGTLKAAASVKGLGWVDSVLAGDWIALDQRSVATYTHRAGVSSSQVSSKAAAVSHAFGLSFGEAWDAWVSLQQLSSANGVTEYSVTLPVRNFLSSLVDDLAGRLTSIVASSASLEPGADRLVRKVAPATGLPLDLWISNGDLEQIAGTYDGQTVTVAIAHPTAGVSAPTGAVDVTPAELSAFWSWDTTPSFISTTPEIGGAQSNLETALTGALTYYTNNGESFTGMLDQSNPTSIYSIDTGLEFSDGTPSTGPHDVSGLVGSDGTYIVLTAWSGAGGLCEGLIRLQSAESTEVLGAADKPGTYYFFAPMKSSAGCEPSAIDHVTATRNLAIVVGSAISRRWWPFELWTRAVSVSVSRAEIAVPNWRTHKVGFSITGSSAVSGASSVAATPTTTTP